MSMGAELAIRIRDMERGESLLQLKVSASLRLGELEIGKYRP